jgi:hypothetical protein
VGVIKGPQQGWARAHGSFGERGGGKVRDLTFHAMRSGDANPSSPHKKLLMPCSRQALVLQRLTLGSWRTPETNSLVKRRVCLYNYSINPKVTHMMHINSAKHVKKTKHEKNVLLGSHVQIAVLTTSRMYHILEYVPNVPMYLEHLPSDVP